MKNCFMIPLVVICVLLPAAAWSQLPPDYCTQWGSYGTEPGQFDRPFRVAIDATGNIYVSDRDNHRIQVFTSSGGYITQWGSYGSEPGQFYYPHGVAVDASGNVYVADAYNCRIQKFTSSGDYITQWGSYGPGPGQFYHPLDVAVDASGSVYVADTGVHRIQVFTSTGEFITQWGTLGAEPGQVWGPSGIEIDASGNVYVVEYLNDRVQVFTSSGDYITQWGSYGSEPGQFYYPASLAVDASGNVYVMDTWNHRMQVFTSSGDYITQWGSRGAEQGQFFAPNGVAVDASGSVYVADTDNNRIQVFGCTLPAVVDFEPCILNVRSDGEWVTCHIELPEGYDVAEIDVRSVVLNGEVSAEAFPFCVSDYDLDGVADLMVKFSKFEVGTVLPMGPDVVVTVTGDVGLHKFSGKDTISVINPPIILPEDGGIAPSVENVSLHSYPNPFNPSVQIVYAVPSFARVLLQVWDIDGRLVRVLEDGERSMGTYTVNWDGRDEVGREVSSGLYVCRLVVGDEVVAKKMTLLR